MSTHVAQPISQITPKQRVLEDETRLNRLRVAHVRFDRSRAIVLGPNYRSFTLEDLYQQGGMEYQVPSARLDGS